MLNIAITDWILSEQIGYCQNKLDSMMKTSLTFFVVEY